MEENTSNDQEDGVVTVAIVGFLHLKDDKRVRKTVEILSKHNRVIYVYWTRDKTEIEYEKGNVKYIPVYHDIGKNFAVEVFKRVIYEYKVIRSLKKFNFDILYLHHFATFLPFGIYKPAKSKGAKIITDFHEYVPEEYMFSLRNKLPVEVVGKKIFRYQVLNSDKIVAVSPYVIKEAQAIKSDIPSLLIPNYACKSVDNVDVNRKLMKKEVIFVGNMRKRMEYEMEILKKLYVLGFTVTFLGIPQNISEEEDGFIKYEKFKPYDEMLIRLSEATFSLVSYSPYDSRGRALKNYIHSFPNKFFDSLAANTPVIVREEYQEMKNVVQRYKVGVVIPKNNVDVAVDKILFFFKERNYKELINNIKSYKDKFVWTETREREFERFVME